MSSDAGKRNPKKILFNNPISPSSWNVNQNVRSVSIGVDEDGNVIAIPVFLVNPNNNPITASSQVQLVGANNSLGVGVNTGSSPPVSYSIFGAPGSNFLQVMSGTFLWNQAENGGDMQELATAAVTAYATNTTTNLLASGGASKKYRIFSLTLTIETGAVGDIVSAGDNAGVNNLFSFTAIGAAVAKQSLRIDFGPGGILQPNAASAISVKANTATAGITGVLSYGNAR